MSLSQDNNKHDLDSFGMSKSGGRDGKNDKAQKTARAALITVIVVAVLFVGSLFINSNFIRQKMTAVTIDNVKYSLTDFEYYYKNLYLQYYQQVSGSSGLGGNGLLPDTNKSLKSQIYDQQTGETWYDFFTKMALEQMKEENKIYVEAQKAGYKLSDDDLKKVDNEIADIKGNAATYGYQDLESYLRAAYGKGMTEEYYKKAAQRTYLIQSYTKSVQDAFSYTPDQLESYYTEHKDSLDTFTYRYFQVTAATVDETKFSDDKALQAAKDQAVEDAGVKAKEYASKISSEQTFIDIARVYDPETFNADDSTRRVYRGELLGSTYGDWMKDPARKEGDVSTFKSSNGYFVVYYISRSNNHYSTQNVQMILVKPETIDQSKFTDDQAGYDAAVADAKAKAEATAKGMNAQWESEGATQDKLTEIGTANANLISDSGLKENVYKTQMPTDVDSWIYDTARKTGDHTLIYDASTGYYILYYVGPGKQYSDMLADNGKRSADLQAWKDSLPVVEPKKTWIIGLSSN